MFSAERIELIKQELAMRGRVMAGEQAARFGVSEDTVRRDLRELAKAGLCRRVYGGALAPAPDGGPLAARERQDGEAKARLARRAVGFLAPRQTVFIDAGSSNIAIARAIPADMELTIATNAPAVAAALDDRPSVRTIVLGGRLDRDKGACVGGSTVQMIDQIRADLFFLGTCGIHAAHGATAFDPEETEVKRAMARNSGTLVAAVTSAKLDTVAPFRIAPMQAFAHLVVEADAPAEVLAGIAARGTRIHRAG